MPLRSRQKTENGKDEQWYYDVCREGKREILEFSLIVILQ